MQVRGMGLQKLSRAAVQKLRAASGAGLPPGFDAVLYCAANPDVAQSFPGGKGAGAHYLRHGITELRRPLPEGIGIDHPESRMLTTLSSRRNWQSSFSEAARKSGGLRALIADHPRAAWLAAPFNLATYLCKRSDVTATIDDPLEGALHFLEFGIEEGEFAYPKTCDPQHIRRHYGLEVPKEPNVDAVVRTLRAQGHDALSTSLTEAEFWELLGMPGAELVRRFDPEFYRASASRAGFALPSPDRLSAIRHFCTTGQAAGLPFAPLNPFDPLFYLGHWAEVTFASFAGPADEANEADQADRQLAALASQTGLEPDRLRAIGFAHRDGAASPEQTEPLNLTEANALYAHWLRRGARLEVGSDLRSWIRHSMGLKVPRDFALRLRDIALRGTLPGLLTERIKLILDRPMLYLGSMSDASPSEVTALVDMGDHKSIRGDNDQAEWLYRSALAVDPAQERALRHLSDLMSRTGRKGAEWQLRNAAADTEGGQSGMMIWNVLTLSELALHFDLPDEAAYRLASIRGAVREDARFTIHYRAICDRLLQHVWDRIGTFAKANGISAAQDRLRRFLEVCSPEIASIPPRSGQIRHVALLGNADLYQCKLYRVDQKAEQLRTAGLEVAVFDPTTECDALSAQIARFDAVILFRVPAFPRVMNVIAAAAALGIPTYYEIDDLVFDSDQFPPDYLTYAGQITRAQHRDIACGVPLYDHAMRLCDYGIASTQTLRDQMATRVRSGQVFVHNNALGQLHLAAISEHATQPPRSKDRRLVIFYGSGTLAHKEDFHDILEPALAEVVRAFPDKVEIRLIGSFGAFRHLDPDRDPVRFVAPVWDFQQYCLMVAEADINLSVLAPSLVTDAKSEIKWLEAAMFGVPSVVSSTATHREVIRDGETGFLAKTSADFARHIKALVKDDSLRARVGQAARSDVMARYGLSAMGDNLVRIFAATTPGPRARKRVLVVNVFYPPQAIGGATRVVHDNVRDLADRYGDAYEVTVLCSREGAAAYTVSAYSEDGIPVWTIGTPDQGGTEMTARDPRMGQVFAELLDRIDPDLVHFHCIQRLTASVVEATRARGTPYVITAHDGWWVSDRQFIIDPETDAPELYDYAMIGTPDAALRARSLWSALSGAAHILCVSEAFSQVYRSCNLPNVVTVENGVSTLPDVQRETRSDGPVRLAHIGGTERHKGLHLLRNALCAQDLTNLQLLVIDHALAPGHVEHEDWGATRVTRTGKVPQSKVDALYAQIDILLAPSVWPESYGLVTREALACGAWVIASDRGAVGADIVEGASGHVVDLSDHAMLADLLAKIDAAPGRYRNRPDHKPELRRSGAQVDELVAIYDGILAKTGTEVASEET